MVWKNVRQNFPDEAEARRAAPQGNKCRISRIDPDGQTDMEPFVG